MSRDDDSLNKEHRSPEIDQIPGFVIFQTQQILVRGFGVPESKALEVSKRLSLLDPDISRQPHELRDDEILAIAMAVAKGLMGNTPAVPAVIPSPGLSAKTELLHRYVNSTAPILVTGPSGSGKSFCCRYLHSLIQGRTPSRAVSFITLSCASLSDSLLESELFGFEEGSFTGANARRAGKLEMAANGVLCLDEISQLSARAQVMLLRVLQEKEFTPLGSSKSLPFSARVISTCSMDLEDALARKILREDFLQRISVLPFALSSRTESREDLAFFIEEFSGEGTTREVKNALLTLYEKASSSRSMNLHELRAFVQRTEAGVEGEPQRDEPSNESLKDAVYRFKLRYVYDILHRCGGNKTRAANMLGIQRTYLSRLLRGDINKTEDETWKK